VRNLGKPVELAGKYFKQGADEVAFLNITGYRDLPLTDAPMLEVLRRSSETVFVPLTVGGGIRDFTDSNGKSYTVTLFLFILVCAIGLTACFCNPTGARSRRRVF
jgi:imidazole glycerol-phosphate synthase